MGLRWGTIKLKRIDPGCKRKDPLMILYGIGLGIRRSTRWRESYVDKLLRPIAVSSRAVQCRTSQSGG
jgi:hypothetical protein